jgi:LysM repeat protein
MNNQNQSPLVPQGSLLEQKNKGRARVKIAVSIVLAVHGIGLLALLMQGCQKEPAPETQLIQTNPPPAFEATNPPPVVEATNPPPVVEATNPPPVVPVVGAADYTIVQGDTFSTLAKKFHVGVKAISDANPGIEPTKLKIGQKIHVPAPSALATTPAGGAAPASEAASGEQVYSVKSGDTLTKIAAQFGTSIKALRAANSLKTDSIKVGQKLKIPAKAPAPPSASSSPAEPAVPGASNPASTTTR